MSTKVDVSPSPPAGPTEDEANQAALDRVNQGGLLEGDTSTPEPDKTERPEWCPEKFARFNEDGTFNASLSAEALAGGHKELEKQFTQKRQADNTDDQTEAEGEAEGDDQQQQTEGETEGEGPVVEPEFWNSLTEEYNEHGDITPESRKILSDMGIPDEMVNDYIEGQKARGGQYHESVVSVLGDNGSAEYDALIDWAEDGNMTEAEAKVFNDAVTSGDITRAQIAIRDLKNQFVRNEGSYANLQLGGGPGGGSSLPTPYASRAQMSDAINDPRYSRDPAYRAEVEKRIGVTNL